MRDTYEVRIGEKILCAYPEQYLSELLIQNGISVDHPCGCRGACRKCTVTVDGKQELSCRYKITSDITVELPDTEDILSVSGTADTNERTDRLCFALDIGTTTLALSLVSLDSGSTVRTLTRTNPQRRFGADVMSRIDHCRKNSTEELTRCLILEIGSMISDLETERPLDMYVSANSTMLHTFFGVDCSSIGVAPYTAAFLGTMNKSGEAMGLSSVSNVISLPSIHSFVGADIVAGMNLIGIPKNGRYHLLVDLGTNAEVMLYSAEHAVCSSAAAGPCFEGANICCGMSATSGAICSVSTDAEGSIAFRTIGDKPAKGICGTGLIEAVSTLIDMGRVDETGFMEEERIELTEDVFLTQADVRQLQLAKSAVFSAIHSLILLEGISFECIDTLYISGGFSQMLDISSAVSIGLLPRELIDKCKVLNNSSLQGTVRYACEHNDLSPYLANAEYIDLSSDKNFSRLFVENMAFDIP